MPEKKNIHKVTIAVTPGATEIAVAPVNPIQEAYVEKYLTKKKMATARTYIYPELHEILSKMVKSCGNPQATIGGYLSEIVLDHFQKNRELMQAIFDDNKTSLFE